MIYKRREKFKGAKILRGGGSLIAVVALLSQNFIFGEGESAKAVFTNLNPSLKRSYTQISGNKNSNPTPTKKLKLSLPTKVGESSPLKRNHREIFGSKGFYESGKKRLALSMPAEKIGEIDKNDPDIWINKGFNVFDQEAVFFSEKIPKFVDVTVHSDYIYETSDRNGIKITVIADGGVGWTRNRDIIWTND